MKAKRTMPHPFKDKEMVLRRENRMIPFRKEEFKIVYHFFSDDEIPTEEFTTPEIEEINIQQVYNQYRDKYNIPFPNEIKEVRNKYGLPANRMSQVLGFGINSYRNYENGEIPSQANGRMIQMAKNPEQFKEMVILSGVYEEDKSKEKELINRIDKRIDFEQKKKNETHFYNYLMDENKYVLPNNETGYVRPSFEKLTEMVVFFSEKMKPFITKMNKLLFYSDFLHYKLNVSSISGARYRAINWGPVPNNYDSIFSRIERDGNILIDRQEKEWGYVMQFKELRPFNPNVFSQTELEIMNYVVREFDKITTGQIVEESHKEDAWIENYNNGKKIMDYKYAFELKNRS